MACRSDDTGWRRVEAGEPELHQIGETWLRGVMSTRVAFEVAQRGLRFRADLGNPSSSTVTVELAGPGPPSRWELAAGEVRSVEAEVRPGGWTLGSPSPIVIASSRVGRPLPHPRTFVLVLVDTLRADHVRPDLMPRTLEFFADGHAFPDVTANASWTLPSVASMFTSRPVLEVTVPDGGILGIPAGMSSWGAWFSDAGFACGAVVANATIHALNGFAAGFDRYVVADPRAGGGSPDATWAIDHAGAWLASRDGEDALLYLHLMDPHEPYRAHRADAPPLPPLRPLAHRERTARPEETARFRARYAGEVAHVDDVLGPFLAELPERSTVLLTSDHGESLGEHGSWGHGLDLYQTAVAVPLLVVGPDVPPGVTDTPRQLLDVTPTLARLAGVDIPDEARGRPLFEDPGDEPIVAATFGAAEPARSSSGPLRRRARHAPSGSSSNRSRPAPSCSISALIHERTTRPRSPKACCNAPAARSSVRSGGSYRDSSS